MTSTHRPGFKVWAAIAVATALLGVGGCASTDSANSTSETVVVSVNDGPHNAQDVTFLQGMIPHHEQAVVMADMIPAMSSNPEMLTLGKEIKAAQAPEIADMTSWLEQWNIPVDSSGGSHVMSDGTTMDGSMMGDGAGMMSEQQMSELNDADASRFDNLWLDMMIEHHEGAIAMSEEELFGGENPQALALATAIISAQEAEITLMKQMMTS